MSLDVYTGHTMHTCHPESGQRFSTEKHFFPFFLLFLGAGFLVHVYFPVPLVQPLEKLLFQPLKDKIHVRMG